jgi:hypothetical protein
MAIGAVEHIASPALVKAWDVRKHISQPSGHDQASGLQHAPRTQLDDESVRLSPGMLNGVCDDLAAVLTNLGTSHLEQFSRRQAV